MNQALRNLAAIPLLWRQRLKKAGDGFRILIFHDTLPREMDAFERFIAYAAHRHGLLTPQQALAWLNGERPLGFDGKTPCLITFDDGFASNVKAGEVVERYGGRAVFYVCPGLINLVDEAQRNAVAKNVLLGGWSAAEVEPLMTWNDLKELQARGHEIGAHGMEHLPLPALSGDALVHEVRGAGAEIAKHITPTQWYAYTFGDIGSITAQALTEVAQSHATCRSGVRGLNGPLTEKLGLRADQIDLKASFPYQQLVCEGGLDGHYAEGRHSLDRMAQSVSKSPTAQSPSK